MNQPFNILIAGVGGQGSLVAGNVLAQAAAISGHRVIIGQIFGASRRGGSVFTHIRIWRKDVGPLIPKEQVDIILGLEPLETLRAAHELAGKKTRVIMSTTEVPTLDTLAGTLEYPATNAILEILEELCELVIAVNPTDTLKKLSASQDLNIYMIGVLSATQDVPFEEGSLEQGICKVVGQPDRSLKVFNKAFDRYSQ